MFSDEFDIQHPERLYDHAVLMNDWMMKGFSQFKLDAANISYRDLIYTAQLLAKDKYDTRVKEMPLVENMISANMVAAKDLDKVVTPKPYIIKEVNGNRFGKSSFKIGIIGLTQPGPGDKSGLIIQEPLQKMREILPELRSKVDLVVVLGYMSLDLSKKMAKDNPGIDIIIGANANPLPPTAQREGNTVIVYSVNQTKSLGELRLYLDAQGKVTDYLNRYIVLDANIPDVPEAAKINETAKKEVEAAKAKYNAEQAAHPDNLIPGQPLTSTIMPPATGQPQQQQQQQHDGHKH
jgi:2',3'-cyclic-nucleotide 2'-phosphodiesterase (5'-nucleotidase family)